MQAAAGQVTVRNPASYGFSSEAAWGRTVAGYVGCVRERDSCGCT